MNLQMKKNRTERAAKSKPCKTIVRVHPASLQLMVDVSWDFAHHQLWNDYPFSEEEIAKAKKYIRRYYRAIHPARFTRTANNRLKVFCERVMLAKKYVLRFPYRYIPCPCIWFNPKNAKGFRGTKEWYERGKVRDGKPIPSFIPPGTGIVPSMPDKEKFFYTHTA